MQNLKDKSRSVGVSPLFELGWKRFGAGYVQAATAKACYEQEVVDWLR